MTAPDRSPSDRGVETAASSRVVQVLLGVALVAVAFATPARPSADVEASFGGGDSPCLAQIVGLAASEVLWLDGTPFFSRRNFTQNTHLYVTEKWAPDPTGHVGPDTLAGLTPEEAANLTEATWDEMPLLIESGVYYNFTDANGVTWNVTEAYMDVHPSVVTDGDGDTAPDDSERHEDVRAGTQRYYVWIVELQDIREDENIGVPSDIGDGGEYNFATRVNTSKFTRLDKSTFPYEVGDPGRNVTHTNDTDARPGFCHPDRNHTHRQYDANLWLGRQPDLVPLGCEPLYAVTASVAAEHALGDLPYQPDPQTSAILTGSYRGGTCTGINGTEAGAP